MERAQLSSRLRHRCYLMARRGSATPVHICHGLVVRLELHQICLDVSRTCFKLHVKVDEGSAYRGDNRSSGDWVHSAEGRILCMGLFFQQICTPSKLFFLIILHFSIAAQFWRSFNTLSLFVQSLAISFNPLNHYYVNQIHHGFC